LDSVCEQEKLEAGKMLDAKRVIGSHIPIALWWALFYSIITTLNTGYFDAALQAYVANIPLGLALSA
jgi:hypothetical protein